MKCEAAETGGGVIKVGPLRLIPLDDAYLKERKVSRRSRGASGKRQPDYRTTSG
jgi:hypothetical protein